MRAKKVRGQKKTVGDIIGWLILAAALVACIVFVLLHAFLPRDNQNDGEDTSETTSVNDASDSASTSTSEGEQDLSGINKRPTQYEGEDPNNSGTITGLVTSVDRDNSSGHLIINTMIDQFLNGGTCTLILSTKEGNEIKRTAPVANDPSSSYCQDFNIPNEAVPSGRWNIKITVKSEDKTGTFGTDWNID